MADSMPTLDNECFFIAPIGEEGSKTRHRSDGILNFIVARAAQELGLTTIRADQIAAPGQITLQVINHVLQAKAAVADLTGRNANVFYELAVRHSARLPVALIVERDEPPLPFDLAQMRTIQFDHRDLASADQCRQAIVAHLREAFGGAVDSPIGASIDLRALGGGNPVERSIAEVLTGIGELSTLQRSLLARIDRLELSQRVRLDPRVISEAGRLGGRPIRDLDAAARTMEFLRALLDRDLLDEGPTRERASAMLQELLKTGEGAKGTSQRQEGKDHLEAGPPEQGPSAPGSEQSDD